MSKVIVTYAAGPHEELLDISLPVFRKFADLHGYDLIVGRKLIDMPPAWNKVALLIAALKEHEQALWLDDDLIIVNSVDDLPMLPKDYCHGLVRHFATSSEVPNTGVWQLNKGAIPLLERMLDLEVFWNHGWWEQAALMTLMGYIVPPEGSDFRQTKCRCVRETRWLSECRFLRVTWNSHPEYRAPVPRIVHCSYPDMKTRIETMRALVDDPGYNYPRWPQEDDE